MSVTLSERLRSAFAPPRYLARSFAGVELSSSSVKAVRLAERSAGVVLEAAASVAIPAGTFASGESADRATIVKAIERVMHETRIQSAHVSLSEAQSYLFETTVPGRTKNAWRTAVEQRLDELVPLPPRETVFDISPIGPAAAGSMRVGGVGFARRVVTETLAVCDSAGLSVASLEGETFAMARALLPAGDESTALIIDIGKTTTKILITARGVPRFATTVNIGGHALTLAVQKAFGVTEQEARRVKAEQGIVPVAGNEDYVAAMLSTLSAIRDEVLKRLAYWQTYAADDPTHEPVSHAILAGGNASLRGLVEYLEGVLRIPVRQGDVFTNLIMHDESLPPVERNESLAFAAAVGLALRDDPLFL